MRGSEIIIYFNNVPLVKSATYLPVAIHKLDSAGEEERRKEKEENRVEERRERDIERRVEKK